MLTSKQEAFCLAVLEGLNASDAYRRAYDAQNMKDLSINRKAKELMDNGNITARINELREPAVKNAGVTLEGQIARLQHLSRQAEASEKYPAAITAEIAVAKLAGLEPATKSELTVKTQDVFVKELREELSRAD